MLILNGKNLGERQKELNVKVNEAAKKKLSLDQVTNEDTDIDKLFKIDLASKYLNINYIIEVLKSGDSLYISRALKCIWMFDDQYSHVINVDNLHHNVFPFMSLKMKKKFLTTAALYIKSPDRASAFYKYCMDTKSTNLALKFIYFTNDDFKLEFLKEKSDLIICYKYKLKHFLGASFTLVEKYLSTLITQPSKFCFLKYVSYLYSLSNEQYLDMLEKHIEPSCYTRLGLRISKDILTKHKHRVLNKPELYIKILNKTSIVRYSTPENAKKYLPAIMPKEVDSFYPNFRFNNEYLLNMIPAQDRFGFIKKLFNDKYPGQIFEMGAKFYEFRYYTFMTAEEKEKWALNQVINTKEVLGAGKNFIFYKFINFDKAFEEIKKLVMITTDSNKRSDVIHILIESAKTQRDLETLFKYYHTRHNNEQKYNKENFINELVNNHNVYEFDKDCWAALDKILQNLEVYSMSISSCKFDYKIIALIYQIINNIEVHEGLKAHIKSQMVFYTLKKNTEKLTKEQEEMVYQYLFNFYMSEVNPFISAPYNEEVKHKARRPIYFLMDVLTCFGKTEKDIPEPVMKLMKLDWDEVKRHRLVYTPPKRTTQEDLIRYLKTDAKLAIDNLPLVKHNIELSYNCTFPVGQFLKKIKVYFSDNVSKEYISFYNTLLLENPLSVHVAQAATYGLFQLADDSYKIDFMLKHAPVESKINRAEIDERLLRIQEAICATAFYSRPPVPLKNVLMYIKGDYVPSCLPMFNSYLANLPLPLCIEFIEAILNAPLSIQKHGIRLAFVCFNTDDLKKLVTHVWDKTKNTSLRLIIYKSLYNKIVNENENAQTALFETLIAFTLKLNQDDDDKLFDVLTSGDLAHHLKSDYMKAVWTVVSALPNTSKINLQRMATVIEHMSSSIEFIRHDVIQPLVEEFIRSTFDSPESISTESGTDAVDLQRAKWELIAKYITYVETKDDLEIKLKLSKSIVSQCLGIFNLVGEGDKYIGRDLCFNFIRDLQDRSYTHNFKCYGFVNVIFENILQTLRESLSIQDIYMLVWEIQMDIAARKAVTDINIYLSTTEDQGDILSTPVKDIIINFGADIGNLIMEHNEKNTYFKSLLPAIQNQLSEEVNTIASCIHGMVSEDILVITSSALMEFKTLDVYLLALNILPLDYSGNYVKEYDSVIREIKNLNNMEITCVMFQKFVNGDFKARASFTP